MKKTHYSKSYKNFILGEIILFFLLGSASVISNLFIVEVNSIIDYYEAASALVGVMAMIASLYLFVKGNFVYCCRVFSSYLSLYFLVYICLTAYYFLVPFAGLAFGSFVLISTFENAKLKRQIIGGVVTIYAFVVILQQVGVLKVNNSEMEMSIPNLLATLALAFSLLYAVLFNLLGAENKISFDFSKIKPDTDKLSR